MLRTVLILVLLAPGTASATDVIHRCQAADGTTVYTDQPCAKLDARPLAPPQKVSEPGADNNATYEPRPPATTMDRGGAVSLGGGSRSDCVRRTDTLLFEIRAAIETRNVNRL